MRASAPCKSHRSRESNLRWLASLESEAMEGRNRGHAQFPRTLFENRCSLVESLRLGRVSCLSPIALPTAAEGRVKRPMRALRLLPKCSRLRLIPTDDHSDQTSESDAHGGGHGDHWASHKQAASKGELQASDRNSLLQLVDRDRDQRPA